MPGPRTGPFPIALAPLIRRTAFFCLLGAMLPGAARALSLPGLSDQPPPQPAQPPAPSSGTAPSSVAVEAESLPAAARRALGREALDVLESAGRNSDPEIRAAAAAAWGEVGNPAAVPLLKKMLRDPSESVRVAAAFSLHTLGDAAGFPVLSKIARQIPPAPEKPSPIERLRLMARERVRIAAIKKLCLIGKENEAEGERVVTIFQDTLNDPSGSVRDATAISLAALGLDEFEAQFLQAAKDQDAEVRSAAVRALGEIGTEDVLPAVLAAAQDASATVRASAMSALASFSPAEAGPALAKGLKDADPRVQAGAVDALSKMEDPDSAVPLQETLKNASDFSVQLPALTGLSRRGRSVDPALEISALKDADEDVRRLAVTALSVTPGLRTLAALRGAMNKDSSRQVRIEAAVATVRRLEKMGRKKP